MVIIKYRVKLIITTSNIHYLHTFNYPDYVSFLMFIKQSIAF